MRTIKFRVWDKELKKYRSEKDGDYSLGVISGKVRGIYGEEFPQMEVQQFTGLHDKNGKEIFEGDKLRDDYSDEETVIEDYAVVVWDGKLCQWAIDNSFAKDISSFTNMVEYFGRENLEVIGNIHENPELLKAVSSK